MEKTEVTVLMSVCNGEKFLSEAIDSILNQTFYNFEFIIIDDDSKDKTLEILLSYNDGRIKIIKNQVNLGLAESLNKGLALARGEYIARMDADDISSLNRLEIQVEYMKRNEHVGVCGTWMKDFGNRSNFHRLPINHDEIVSQLFFGYAVAHATTMMRTDILKKLGGYDPLFNLAEDYELWTRISNITNMHNYPKVLYFRRIHKDNIVVHSVDIQSKLCEIIRKRLLARIGIIPTEFEEQLHTYICGGQCYDHFSITDVELWLNKIIEANNSKVLYPEPAFSRVVERYFFQIIRKSEISLFQKYSKLIFSDIRKSTSSDYLSLINKLAIITASDFLKIYRNILR